MIEFITIILLICLGLLPFILLEIECYDINKDKRERERKRKRVKRVKYEKRYKNKVHY